MLGFKTCYVISDENKIGSTAGEKNRTWYLVTNEMVSSVPDDVTYTTTFNPLKPELNPICYLLALLGAHHFLHVSRIRVKLLTFKLLMSYIYIYIYIYIYTYMTLVA